MDLYWQEAETTLLGAFLPHLQSRDVIDVGAERGAFIAALREAGASRVYAIEPEPSNASFLRSRFAGDTDVVVHEVAATTTDGQVVLHKSVGPSGEPLTYGHTVLDRPNTDEIAWRETFTVAGRSLASLVDAGDVPSRVGVLKVDVEGHDHAVIAGIGALDCDVVMIEHWSELPNSLGPCPWTTDEMVSELGPRGFSQFALLLHRERAVLLKWNDGDVPYGRFANLVFFHDRVVDRLWPLAINCAAKFAEKALEELEAEIREVNADREARLEVIQRLDAELKASDGERAAPS